MHHGQAGQNAVALAQRRIAGAGDEQHDGLDPLAMPFQRPREQVAIGVRGLHLQHADRRQAVRVAIAALALFQMPLGLKLFEDAFQIDPIRALDAKGLGDIAFRGQGGVRRDPVQDLLLGGDASHVFGLAWVCDRVMTKKCSGGQIGHRIDVAQAGPARRRGSREPRPACRPARVPSTSAPRRNRPAGQRAVALRPDQPVAAIRRRAEHHLRAAQAPRTPAQYARA